MKDFFKFIYSGLFIVFGTIATLVLSIGLLSLLFLQINNYQNNKRYSRAVQNCGGKPYIGYYYGKGSFFYYLGPEDDEYEKVLGLYKSSKRTQYFCTEKEAVEDGFKSRPY